MRISIKFFEVMLLQCSLRVLLAISNEREVGELQDEEIRTVSGDAETHCLCDDVD
jgi:hypothetical protein